MAQKLIPYTFTNNSDDSIVLFLVQRLVIILKIVKFGTGAHLFLQVDRSDVPSHTPNALFIEH